MCRSPFGRMKLQLYSTYFKLLQEGYQIIAFGIPVLRRASNRKNFFGGTSPGSKSYLFLILAPDGLLACTGASSYE